MKAPCAPKGWEWAYDVGEILSRHCGERGFSEGAEDTLIRIINERDKAMTALALAAMNARQPPPFEIA